MYEPSKTSTLITMYLLTPNNPLIHIIWRPCWEKCPITDTLYIYPSFTCSQWLQREGPDLSPAQPSNQTWTLSLGCETSLENNLGSPAPFLFLYFLLSSFPHPIPNHTKWFAIALVITVSKFSPSLLLPAHFMWLKRLPWVILSGLFISFSWTHITPQSKHS